MNFNIYKPEDVKPWCSPCVYGYFDADNNLLYVGSSNQGVARFGQLERFVQLRAMYVEVCWFETEHEAREVEVLVIHQLRPPYNGIPRNYSRRKSPNNFEKQIFSQVVQTLNSEELRIFFTLYDPYSFPKEILKLYRTKCKRWK